MQFLLQFSLMLNKITYLSPTSLSIILASFNTLLCVSMMKETLQASFSVFNWFTRMMHITINIWNVFFHNGSALIPFPWKSSQRKHYMGQPPGTLCFHSAPCSTSLRILHFTHSLTSSAVSVSLLPTSKVREFREQKIHNIQVNHTLHLTHRGGGKADYCCSTKIQEEGWSQAISKLVPVWASVCTA